MHVITGQYGREITIKLLFHIITGSCGKEITVKEELESPLTKKYNVYSIKDANAIGCMDLVYIDFDTSPTNAKH